MLLGGHDGLLLHFTTHHGAHVCRYRIDLGLMYILDSTPLLYLQITFPSAIFSELVSYFVLCWAPYWEESCQLAQSKVYLQS
jgi:hypothetical protein